MSPEEVPRSAVVVDASVEASASSLQPLAASVISETKPRRIEVDMGLSYHGRRTGQSALVALHGAVADRTLASLVMVLGASPLRVRTQIQRSRS